MIARFPLFPVLHSAQCIVAKLGLELDSSRVNKRHIELITRRKKTKSSCTSVLSVLLVMSTTRVSNKILTFFLPTPTHEPLECKIVYYVHTICRKQNIHITYWATYLREGSSRLSMRKLWPENQKIIKSLVHHAFEEVLWRKTWERDRVGVWDLYPSSHTFTALFPRLPNKVDQGRD